MFSTQEGITPFALMIPLYPKVVNESVTKTFNFKERLVNVKIKDIDAWTTEHLSKNWNIHRHAIVKTITAILEPGSQARHSAHLFGNRNGMLVNLVNQTVG